MELSGSGCNRPAGLPEEMTCATPQMCSSLAEKKKKSANDSIYDILPFLRKYGSIWPGTAITGFLSLVRLTQLPLKEKNENKV